MRNLIILGHPRSGKTSLASEVMDKFAASVISMDSVAKTFGDVFPELGMHIEPDKKEPVFSKFFFKYIDNVAAECPNRMFVAEGCHISPKTTAQMINGAKWQVIVLGCSNITSEQFAFEMQKYDRPNDWTACKCDEELHQIAECFIKIAKNAETECKEMGIEFIDTSFDRKQKFEKFISSLK